MGGGGRRGVFLSVVVLVIVVRFAAVVLLHALGIPILPLEASAIAAHSYCYHHSIKNNRLPTLLTL